MGTQLRLGWSRCNMVLMEQAVFVCVVLATSVPQAAARQEKIRPNSSTSRTYFTNTDSVFKYSADFAFDPFTPFPELPSSTPAPNSRRIRTSEKPKTETITELYKIHQTEPPNKKVIILRKKKITKTSGKMSSKVQHNASYEVISEKKSQKSTDEWVQSILSRTTRRPTTTTTPASTPSPTTPSTTPAPFLTRELQLQLQQMLARRNLPEQSRSSPQPEYFSRQQLPSERQQVAPQYQYTTKQQYTQKPFPPQPYQDRSVQQFYQQQSVSPQLQSSLRGQPKEQYPYRRYNHLDVRALQKLQFV